MAKKDTFLDDLLKIGAIIGGAFLAIEAIKALSKPKTVYSCPNCRSDIEYGIKNCPTCKTPLTWGKEVENG